MEWVGDSMQLKGTFLSARSVRAFHGAGLIVICAALFPNPARAGFFDFLLEPFKALQGQNYGAPGGFHRPRTHPPHPHRAAGPKKLIVANRSGPRHAPGPVDLMDDESLRRGDVVMTQDGIRIFVGPSSDHHQPEDFRSISEVKNLSSRERQALIGLDGQTTGVQGARPATADLRTGRSAAGSKITAGETITDPNGRTIRYVGP